MNNVSSGCYVIDSEYNVINVNSTMRSTFPQLEIGKKCYKCLMNLDEPCGPCPVANGVKGPSTYTDPIRDITEIVDAVEIEIEGFGLCHALILSTVENEAAFAATLPTSSEDLKNLALIKALTIDYYDVFSVNLNQGNMTLYRLNGKSLSADSMYKETKSYEKGVDNYIRKYVIPEDQETMQEQCSLEYIRRVLSQTESFVIHYRVNFNQEIHYFYRKIVRIGSPEDFENIVVGVACEDEEVHNLNKQKRIQSTLKKVELDTNTGLLTKEAFFVYGDSLLQKHPDQEFDFCIVKVKNLDSINRQYGSIVKDKLLKTIGEIFKSYENETSCIAYFGEDAFGSFSENISTEARKKTIEKFQQEIAERSNIKNISFQWAFYKNVNKNIDVEEIYRTITYIFSSIHGNSNKDYIELDEKTAESMNWEISVEKNFRKALENKEFTAWFQPKYSVQTKKIVGAEALVRWIMPDGEMVPPIRFVPILENRGLINLLDEEIFRQVCEMQSEFKNNGLHVIPVSVNLSRASLFTKDIPTIYSEIAERYQTDPGLVPIEITESAAVRATMIGDFADSLIDKGFALHMDDFGSGYSSLVSLQAISFEGIKLDKSLIDYIGKPSGESLLRHTIAFVKENGMTAIAEGVETQEQFAFLKEAGCDMIQGFYFSKPVNKETLIEMLKEMK